MKFGFPHPSNGTTRKTAVTTYLEQHEEILSDTRRPSCDTQRFVRRFLRVCSKKPATRQTSLMTPARNFRLLEAPPCGATRALNTRAQVMSLSEHCWSITPYCPPNVVCPQVMSEAVRGTTEQEAHHDYGGPGGRSNDAHEMLENGSRSECRYELGIPKRRRWQVENRDTHEVRLTLLA